MNFHPRFSQSFRYKLANLIAHAGDDLVAHLDHEDAGLAGQVPPLKGIAEQISHLRRELNAAGPRTDYGERQSATRILGWEVGGNMIECIHHALTQQVGVHNLTEGNRKLLCSFNTSIIGDAADCENEDFV